MAVARESSNGAPIEDLGERGHVHRERIDHGDTSSLGELEQRQACVVGALPVELCVEAIDIGLGQSIDEPSERRGVVDPLHHDMPGACP